MARHYGMDWLRIGAFGLLIFYHIGMVFVPWAYHAKTAHPIDWVTIPMQALNAWRLSLLFVVSGYASRAIFAGEPHAGRFFWGRTKRLVPPVLFAMAVINPLQPWVELTTQHGYTHDFRYFLANDYFHIHKISGISVPTWQHLWFVVYLFVYTALLSVALAVLPARARAGVSRAAGWVLSGPLVILVPVALLVGNWAWSFPGVAETHDLFNDLPAHRLYLPMFLFGFLLRESAPVWAAIRRWWRVAAMLAGVAYGIVATVEAIYLKSQIPLDHYFWFGMVRAVQSWCSVVALLGVADRYLNHDAPGRAMLNEAVFPFYIIHQTIIVGVAGALLGAGIGPLAEFAVLLATTTAGCWLFYRLGREIVPLRPLIGLRLSKAPRPARPRVAA
ncbi:acyltransferase family protein [Sphingomonas sp.]|uniref:acyltransferase family protein n=1 Tax=Sphingomonas sp. TaxID=28214 RepID=UPI001E0FA63A|nr:acyltransferase family protein [Sphingomonas sp.]MBX9797660.1 acyltransferase family protein [Sphingomonas sp.]